LNVGGSFVATTANAIQFGDRGFFSASAPNVPPVLTVNPSALLFNQIASQPIANQSVTGLQLPANQSLLLVGGDVNLEGGKLSAPSGRVE
jgi:large exoprotein involved in heme utilization and adhesion